LCRMKQSNASPFVLFARILFLTGATVGGVLIYSRNAANSATFDIELLPARPHPAIPNYRSAPEYVADKASESPPTPRGSAQLTLRNSSNNELHRHQRRHRQQPQQQRNEDGKGGPRLPQQRKSRPRNASVPMPMVAQTAKVGDGQQSLPRSQLEAPGFATSAGKPPVAICMTGEPRTLHSPPVKTCMRRNLAAIAPYDVFVIFRGDGKHTDLDHEASRVPIQPVVHLEFAPNFRASQIGCERQEELQHRCFEALQRKEIERQVDYKWVVRLRPDLLILKALPALAQLEALSPRPRILLPPFAEFYFDPVDCMKWQGTTREEYDADYKQCSVDQLHMSHHLMSDQFAIIPRGLAKAYLNRVAPKWTYPIPNRPTGPPTSGEHLELWETCVLDKEHDYRIGPGFLGGCECSLSVAVRHMQNASTLFVPFHVALYRGKGGIHMAGTFPNLAREWAFQEGL